METNTLSNMLFVNSQLSKAGGFDISPARQRKTTGSAQVDSPQGQEQAANEAGIAQPDTVNQSGKSDFEQTLNKETEKRPLGDEQKEPKAAVSDKEPADSTKNVENSESAAKSTEGESQNTENTGSTGKPESVEQLISAMLSNEGVDKPVKSDNGQADVAAEGQQADVNQASKVSLSDVVASKAGEQGDKNQDQATAETTQAATPATVKQNSEAETIADAPTTAAAKEQKADGDETNKPLETAAPSGDANVAKATEKTQAANAPAQEASAKDFQAEVKTAQNNTNNGESTKSVAAEDLAEGLKSEVKNSNDKSASGKETLLSSATQQGRADIGVNSDSANAPQVTDVRAGNTDQARQPQGQQFSEQIYNKAGEQINSAIRNSVEAGGSEVTVKLNPPELGSVSIKLQQNHGEITGTLEFSKAETKSEIQQLLPQLVRSLQEAGISVKKLDVVQTQIDNSSQQQQFRENIGQDASAFAQQFGQSNSNASGSASGYEWASADSAYMTDELLSQSYITDQAVNMLV